MCVPMCEAAGGGGGGPGGGEKEEGTRKKRRQNPKRSRGRRSEERRRRWSAGQDVEAAFGQWWWGVVAERKDVEFLRWWCRYVDRKMGEEETVEFEHIQSCGESMVQNGWCYIERGSCCAPLMTAVSAQKFSTQNNIDYGYISPDV